MAGVSPASHSLGVGTVSSVVSPGSARGPLPSHEGAITPVALSHGAEGCAGAGRCDGTACGHGSSPGARGRELSWQEKEQLAGCAGHGQRGKWKHPVTRRAGNGDREREQAWVETWAGNGSEARRVGVWGEEGGELGSGGSGKNCRGGAGEQRCWGAGWGSEMGTSPGWEQPCPRDALTRDFHAVGVEGGSTLLRGAGGQDTGGTEGSVPKRGRCRSTAVLSSCCLRPWGAAAGRARGAAGPWGAAVAWAAWHGGGGQAWPAMPAAMNQMPAAPQPICLLCRSDLRPAPSRTALICISASSCYLVMSRTGIRGWCRWFSSSSPGQDQSEPCSDL